MAQAEIDSGAIQNNDAKTGHQGDPLPKDGPDAYAMGADWWSATASPSHWTASEITERSLPDTATSFGIPDTTALQHGTSLQLPFEEIQREAMSSSEPSVSVFAAPDSTLKLMPMSERIKQFTAAVVDFDHFNGRSEHPEVDHIEAVRNLEMQFGLRPHVDELTKIENRSVQETESDPDSGVFAVAALIPLKVLAQSAEPMPSGKSHKRGRISGLIAKATSLVIAASFLASCIGKPKDTHLLPSATTSPATRPAIIYPTVTELPTPEPILGAPIISGQALIESLPGLPTGALNAGEATSVRLTDALKDALVGQGLAPVYSETDEGRIVADVYRVDGTTVFAVPYPDQLFDVGESTFGPNGELLVPGSDTVSSTQGNVVYYGDPGPDARMGTPDDTVDTKLLTVAGVQGLPEDHAVSLVIVSTLDNPAGPQGQLRFAVTDESGNVVGSMPAAFAGDKDVRVDWFNNTVTTTVESLPVSFTFASSYQPPTETPTPEFTVTPEITATEVVRNEMKYTVEKDLGVDFAKELNVNVESTDGYAFNFKVSVAAAKRVNQAIPEGDLKSIGITQKGVDALVQGFLDNKAIENVIPQFLQKGYPVEFRLVTNKELQQLSESSKLTQRKITKSDGDLVGITLDQYSPVGPKTVHVIADVDTMINTLMTNFMQYPTEKERFDAINNVFAMNLPQNWSYEMISTMTHLFYWRMSQDSGLYAPNLLEWNALTDGKQPIHITATVNK